MKPFLLPFLLITLASAHAQNIHKQLAAKRTSLPIIIDGNLNDTAWKQSPVATNFIEFRPDFGRVEDEKNKTEIRLLYDDNAIYVSGFCHETSKDSIATELVGRDVIGVNDYVDIAFDTYHDKINGFNYYITPLGEQADSKQSSSGEDFSWNSVYYSAAKIVDGGWTFELRIPYSAIRFDKNPKQTWGISFTRRRQKAGRHLSWNPIDPKVNGFFNQAGEWTGIENIKSPRRLSLSPYFSAYANHYPVNQQGESNWSNSVSGGMDVKYGISQSFTLDMTLIPDFGQVQSDNLILNLTPYEVKYAENRPFFTEGTELFSKGNLFYSRRIGGSPLHHDNVEGNLGAKETVIKNPSETKMLNGIKVSGRTSHGLGVGVFNAIIGSTQAVIQDSLNVLRKVETNPLTNYNIIVLDQALKHNSSISFINTSVLRSGGDYDANVSAALFDIYDKHVNYNFWGKVSVSKLYSYNADKSNLNGYSHNLSFGKTSGNFTWTVTEELADNSYRQNDIGYATVNNYFNHSFWLGYKLLKPKSFYNNLYLNVNGGLNKRFEPAKKQGIWCNTNINGQLKNLWNGGIELDFIGTQNDFYESRLEGKTFRRPYYFGGSIWFGTNPAKKYYVEFNTFQTQSPAYHSAGSEYNLFQRFRFNNKLTLSHSIMLGFQNADLGYAAIQDNNSLFGLRNRRTVENVLGVKYNFNNKMGLTLRARHYWSSVGYLNYFLLDDDGIVKSTAIIPGDNPNSNVNFINVDMTFSWQFAQGSFINIVWKDAAQAFDSDFSHPYFHNFSSVYKEPQLNSFSLRVIYYLDALSLKRKRLK